MSAWEQIHTWTAVDPAEPALDAVYIRALGTEPERAHRLVGLPVVGYDERDQEPLVIDPADHDLLVRVADTTLNDGACLYLGLYDRGRQPSWAALEGAKAILADRGIKAKKGTAEIR